VPDKTSTIESLHGSAEKSDALEALRVMESRLLEIKKVRSPLEHGFADLLGEELVNKRHTESDKEHALRQQQAIYDFVSSTLYLVKDGKRQYIKLVPEARRLIADIFYERVNKAILWKSRGGGGSTSAAVLIFLMMVYKSKEFTNLAGSGSQARSIYEKVVEFCSCNPQVYQYLIDGDPLISRTHFYNGAKLHCINATDKQVRSRHDSGLIIDEGCLLPGSKVITERGIINVEDVVPGDCVVNQDGIITSVKNVWSKDWDNRVVNISLNGWSTGLELTHDHRVKIIRGLDKGNPKRKDSVNESSAEWVHAEDISDRDYVLIPKIKTSDIDDCILADTYDGGKWLGYWLGDGWTGKQRSRGIYVVFNSKDKRNIDEYVSISKDLFGREVCFDNSSVENRINTDTALFTHKELADFLDTTFGTKSTEKGMPFDFIAGQSKDFVRGVISGLIASDGTVWEGKASSGGVCKRASIQTSSEALAASIFTCLAKLGVAASYRERPAKISNIRGKEYCTKESWVIDINGKAMSLFTDTDDSDRKQKAFNSWVEIDNYIAVPVKSVESRHYSGEVWDIEVKDGESFMMMNAVVHNCQEDLKAGEVMKTALQNALTQPEHLILILSTFHHPEGFFQEYWDDAETHGFTRYKWSVYDTMVKCELDIDCADCYLSEVVNEHDERGRVIGTTVKGCNGTARKAEGYQSFEAVCDIKKVNEGSSVYTVEFECERPKFYGSIYDIEALAESEWEDITWYEEIEKSVGLDWGYVGQTAICMTVRSEIGVGVLETAWFHEQKIGEIIGYLNKLREEYGNFVVFADSSDQFSNRELHEEGFKVIPVVFKKWKEFGIQNVSKFLTTGRLQFLKDGEGNDQLLSQLRRYRADGNGKPIKKDDHGPDALMCAMLNWRYFEMFAGSPNLRKMHPEQYQDKDGSIDGEQKRSKIDANQQVILI